MSEKLEGLEGVEVLIDDIIVHCADQQQHDQRLSVVLNKLVEANITLNLKKCEFNVKTVKVLGHVISSNGISADPSKVNAITSMQKPSNVKELRSFLGMVNHLVNSKVIWQVKLNIERFFFAKITSGTGAQNRIKLLTVLSNHFYLFLF